MPAPWERYQSAPPASSAGPWARYGGSAPAPSPDVPAGLGPGETLPGVPKPSTAILSETPSGFNPAHPLDNFRSNTQMRRSDGTLGTALHNYGAATANNLVAPITAAAHPIDTLGGVAKVVAHPIDAARNAFNGAIASAKDDPAQFVESVLGGATGGLLLGEAGAPALRGIAEPLQASGGKVIDRAVGSLEKDFRHGAQPGRAYLEGGGTPAISMRRLGDKAATVASGAGSQIRPLLEGSDTVIPADKVFDAVAEPVGKLRGMQSGFGGTGVAPQVEGFEDHLIPSLMRVGERGGSTPLQVYDEMKRPMQEMTNWKDPTQFDLNTVRQQTTGRLGGLIADAVPEVRPLNRVYQGSNNLAQRAYKRANTGSAPLTALMRRGAEAGLLNSLGGPGAALGAAFDSVPGLSTAGYGLFQAGRAANALAPALPALTTLGGAAIGVQPPQRK